MAVFLAEINSVKVRMGRSPKNVGIQKCIGWHRRGRHTGAASEACRIPARTVDTKSRLRYQAGEHNPSPVHWA
jgi:hypothetical protein